MGTGLPFLWMCNSGIPQIRPLNKPICHVLRRNSNSMAYPVSEGYDRKHLGMPNCQNALIEAVAEAQPNTIVVLHNGAPVEMPWLGKVKAVLEAYLGGQAVGGAVVNVLYGNANPSGRLAETFPLRIQAHVQERKSYSFT